MVKAWLIGVVLWFGTVAHVQGQDSLSVYAQRLFTCYHDLLMPGDPIRLRLIDAPDSSFAGQANYQLVDDSATVVIERSWVHTRQALAEVVRHEMLHMVWGRLVVLAYSADPTRVMAINEQLVNRMQPWVQWAAMERTCGLGEVSK